MGQRRDVRKLDYKKAGVDIDKANLFLRSIKPLIRSTRRKEVLKDIGPFSALFSMKEYKKFKHPILVASSDGVGTKIRLCSLCGKYWVAGYDLVAMNVNDIITCGAQPLFFLDYLAMGKLDPKIARELIRGMVKGCRDSGMSLIGGETAELPGFYKEGEFELAGFAVGIVEGDQIIDGQGMKSGDIIIGLRSSGPHSNGYSLIRKVFKEREIKERWHRYLLAPTRIYVKEILNLIGTLKVKGMAHITGGGFYDNIKRILPRGLNALIWKGSWSIPFIFKEIQVRGRIDEEEMFRTFNMGIGYVVVIAREEERKLKGYLKELNAYVIGEIEKGKGEVLIV